MESPLILEIRGPGHHERAGFARQIVEAVAGKGMKVAVEADLRPRLASDLAEMLGGGAVEVLLYASNMIAKVVAGPEMANRNDLAPLHEPNLDVIVRLVPSDGRVRVVFADNPDADAAESVDVLLRGRGITPELS